MQYTREHLLLFSLLAASLLVGCPKKKIEEAPGFKIEDLWVDRTRVTFKDHVTWTEGAPEAKDSSENTSDVDSELAKKCQGTASAHENIDDPGGSDEFTSITYYCRDDKSVGHYAMVVPEQRSTETYKIKYELLAPVRLGQSWSSEHNDSNGKDLRSCQVRSSRYCDDGVSTVCVTEKAAGSVTWLRQHYCKGQGWRGYEVVMLRGGAVGMRGWSSRVVADGVALDDVGDPTDLPTYDQVLGDAKAIVEAANKQR